MFEERHSVPALEFETLLQRKTDFSTECLIYLFEAAKHWLLVSSSQTRLEIGILQHWRCLGVKVLILGVLPDLLPELTRKESNRGGGQHLQEHLEHHLEDALLHVGNRAEEGVELVVWAEDLLEDTDRLAELLLGELLIDDNWGRRQRKNWLFLLALASSVSDPDSFDTDPAF